MSVVFHSSINAGVKVYKMVKVGHSSALVGFVLDANFCLVEAEEL